MKRFTCFLILMGTLCAQAAGSSYNDGVKAWQKKDYAQARAAWTQTLGEGGPAEAYNNLGFLYFYGMGGPRDRERAVELWRNGAVLAVSEAQSHLADAYRDGHGGLKESKARAYAWYKCSMATTQQAPDDSTEEAIRKEAAASLASLRLRMTATELAEGERLAQEFIARYSRPLAE